MSEEIKPEVKPEAPKEAPKVEPKEEPAVEAAAEKMADAVVSKWAAFETKLEKKAADRLDKLASVKSVDSLVPMYTTKSGKVLTMKKSTVEQMGLYFKALLNKDYVGAKNVINKIQVLNETTVGDGGYLVPEEWSNLLVPMVEDKAVIRGLARVMNITSNKLNVPTVVSNPKAAWGSEQGLKSTTSMEFSELELTPYKLTALAVITEELVQDALVDITRIVTEALATAIAKEEDNAFATGSGTGQPTGFATGYTPIWTKACGGLGTWSDINQAFMRMTQDYRKTAVWVGNMNTLANVMSTKTSTGAPIYNNSFNTGSLPTLMGRPMYEQNDLADGLLCFVDLNWYFIAQRMGLTVRTSTEATVNGDGAAYSLWQRNALGILVEERVDGELATTRALTTLTGF
jgi:HK97 family phage major capsid protein